MSNAPKRVSRFYLPHGLTVDGEGNYWMTDVALHQVFKFSEEGKEPLLTLGKRYKYFRSEQNRFQRLPQKALTHSSHKVGKRCCESHLRRRDLPWKITSPSFLWIQKKKYINHPCFAKTFHIHNLSVKSSLKFAIDFSTNR